MAFQPWGLRKEVSLGWGLTYAPRLSFFLLSFSLAFLVSSSSGSGGGSSSLITSLVRFLLGLMLSLRGNLSSSSSSSPTGQLVLQWAMRESVPSRHPMDAYFWISVTRLTPVLHIMIRCTAPHRFHNLPFKYIYLGYHLFCGSSTQICECRTMHFNNL